MSFKSVLQRQATPFTTSLFVISAVSGVALFFHVGTAWFREMHEILSLVLLVPFALHVWRNWPAFVGYFKRGAMTAAIVGGLVLSGLFVYEAESGGSAGNPMMTLATRAQQAPLSALAPLLGITDAALVDRLKAAGIADATAADSLAGIAARTGRDAFEMAAIATTPASP